LDPKRVQRIDALTLDEARQSLDESLRKMAEDVGGLGGIVGHPDLWARRMAPATHGWPQHVTCHLRAAAEALLGSQRLAFDDDNLGSALDGAAVSMTQYYDQRLGAARTHQLVVFAVHEAIKDHLVRRPDAMAVVDIACEMLGRYEREDHRQNFRHTGDCVDQMLYAGVIAYASTGPTSPLSIPIPSMATYIAGLLSAGQRDAVRKALGHTAGH
jgi:hypothetical protein